MCYNVLEVKYKYDTVFSQLQHIDMSTYIEQVGTDASWGNVVVNYEGSEHYEVYLANFNWRMNGHATNGVNASSGRWILQYLSAVNPDTWVDCYSGTGVLKECTKRYGEGWLLDAPQLGDSGAGGAILWKNVRLYEDRYRLRVILRDQDNGIKWDGDPFTWYD